MFDKIKNYNQNGNIEQSTVQLIIQLINEVESQIPKTSPEERYNCQKERRRINSLKCRRRKQCNRVPKVQVQKMSDADQYDRRKEQWRINSRNYKERKRLNKVLKAQVHKTFTEDQQRINSQKQVILSKEKTKAQTSAERVRKFRVLKKQRQLEGP